MRPVAKVSFDPVVVYGLEEVVGIILVLRLVGLLRVEPRAQHEGVHEPWRDALGEEHGLAGAPGETISRVGCSAAYRTTSATVFGW